MVYRKLIEVNGELKDHWAIVRNYEGIINCYKHTKVTQIEKYLEIIEKMVPKYRLEEAEINMINTFKEYAE